MDNNVLLGRNIPLWLPSSLVDALDEWIKDHSEDAYTRSNAIRVLLAESLHLSNVDEMIINNPASRIKSGPERGKFAYDRYMVLGSYAAVAREMEISRPSAFNLIRRYKQKNGIRS